MTLRLYTIGYRDAMDGKRREPEDFYQGLPREAAVVDVRSHPYSPFCPPYTGSGVGSGVRRWKSGITDCYHIKGLGNIRREGSGKRIAPPRFFDEETGFPMLIDIMQSHGAAVIFCACSFKTLRDSRYRCHRFYIADEMKSRIPELEVIHLP